MKRCATGRKNATKWTFKIGDHQRNSYYNSFQVWYPDYTDDDSRVKHSLAQKVDVGHHFIVWATNVREKFNVIIIMFIVRVTIRIYYSTSYHITLYFPWSELKGGSRCGLFLSLYFLWYFCWEELFKPFLV